MHTEMISLKLPAALGTRLTVLAQRRKVSKSAILREAIDAYLRAGSGPRAGSCLALAKDLAGCVAGTGDLSSNKKRMRGCGR